MPVISIFTVTKAIVIIIKAHTALGARKPFAFVGYLPGTGQMDLTRELKEIEREVDYLNSFKRNRHGKKGAETPVALFEWISVRDIILDIYR
jgi:hypothetical protein